MNLAVTIREYCLTSLTIARNCNSVLNVCLNPNVNIYRCIKITLLAHLRTPASIEIFITQTSSSAQAVFFLLPILVTSIHTLQTAATQKKKKNSNSSTAHTHTYTHYINWRALHTALSNEHHYIHTHISRTSFKTGYQLQRTILLVLKSHPSRITNWYLWFSIQMPTPEW
jgi:hypothetical protein